MFDGAIARIAKPIFAREFSSEIGAKRCAASGRKIPIASAAMRAKKSGARFASMREIARPRTTFNGALCALGAFEVKKSLRMRVYQLRSDKDFVYFT